MADNVFLNYSNTHHHRARLNEEATQAQRKKTLQTKERESATPPPPPHFTSLALTHEKTRDRTLANFFIFQVEDDEEEVLMVDVATCAPVARS